MEKRAKVNFYILTSFNNQTHRGSYDLLLEYYIANRDLDYRKPFHVSDVRGNSSVHLILFGIIDGLKKMKKRELEITICTNTPFGIMDIYQKDGKLRSKAIGKANREEKEVIRQLLHKSNHTMNYLHCEYVKQKVKAEETLYR